MSVRITGSPGLEAAIFDSVTGLAFGPVYQSVDEAEDFIEWFAAQVETDIRTVPIAEIEAKLVEFRAEREESASC